MLNLVSNQNSLTSFSVQAQLASSEATKFWQTAKHLLVPVEEETCPEGDTWDASLYAWSLDKYQMVWKRGRPVQTYKTINQANEALKAGHAPESFKVLFCVASIESMEKDTKMFTKRVRKIIAGTQYSIESCKRRSVKGHVFPTHFVIHLKASTQAGL